MGEITIKNKLKNKREMPTKRQLQTLDPNLKKKSKKDIFETIRNYLTNATSNYLILMGEVMVYSCLSKMLSFREAK